MRKSMETSELLYELKLKRAAEKNWIVALNSIKDFIVFTDIDGRYEFVNRIIEGLPHTRESILGLSFKDFVPESYHSRITLVLEKVKDSKQHGFYRTEGIGPNGKKSYYFTQVSPRIIDDKVIGFVFCSRDVTEEFNEREKWRSLAESCPDIILTVEADLKISFINRESWLPNLQEGVEKNHLWSFVPKKSRSVVVEALKRVEESKTIDSYEILAPGEHGKDTWYAVTVGPRLREGKIVGYTMVAKDIGPLRYALEEAKKSNVAKSRFIANISHELRTPLTSIMGHTELLSFKTEDNDTFSKSLQIISKNCKNLLARIDDILVLANIDGKRDSVNFKLCNPAHEALSVIDQHLPLARENGIRRVRLIKHV